MLILVLGAGIDASLIIGLCVLAVTVLRWFVNVIQGNTPDGVPRPEKPKSKPQQGRSEIETLLQELSGEKKKPKPERREQPPRPPKPPAERGRTKPKQAPQRPGAAPPYVPSRQAPRVADTHLSSSNLGGGVRSHQMGNRVEAAVQQEITSVVQHDLGNRIAAALPPTERPVHPLVKVLRDPNGVRQAILLNEILQRPKARRY